MNPSDSKKLEEIKKDWDANQIIIKGDVDWLLSKIAEQDRMREAAAACYQEQNYLATQVGQIRDRAEKAEAYATEQEDIIKDLQAKIKEQGREIAEAREEGIEEAYRAGYEEAAGAPEELENCLYEWLKENGK